MNSSLTSAGPDDSVIGRAIREVAARFPFPSYVSSNEAPYWTVGRLLCRLLDPGARILDFGSGPCDKTAVASLLGYDCVAIDDLGDHWVRHGSNLKRIMDFARDVGVDLTTEYTTPEPQTFDAILMNDVLEHLHDSPRGLLVQLLSGLRPGGYLLVTVPNLGNARKRLDLLRGETNLPAYELLFFYEGPWRGPVREYVRRDLESLVLFLNLDVVELSTVDHMLVNLPAWLRGPYIAVTRILPDLKDTWVLVARLPLEWDALTLPTSDPADLLGRKGKRNLYMTEGS